MNKKFDDENSNSHKSILGVSIFLIGLIAVFFVGARFAHSFTGNAFNPQYGSSSSNPQTFQSPSTNDQDSDCGKCVKRCFKSKELCIVNSAGRSSSICDTYYLQCMGRCRATACS